MPMKSVWVVKIGGSLAYAPELKPWLDTLAEFGGGRIIIVPGGGPFADEVRRAQKACGFNDGAAHHMALLAMEQYGLMMTGIRTDLIPVSSLKEMKQALSQGKVGVWLPSVMTVGNPDIPESWDLSSDSLAAWLSDTLHAEKL